VIVHDRYQNYDAFDGIAHQLCTQHLLRDLEDAAQTYPGAIWPGQIADALRGLIHAANVARGQGLVSVPGDAIAEHLRLFRNGVNVGLSQIRRIPGGKKVKQPPALNLLECLRDRQADVLRSSPTPPSRPPPTRPNAMSGPRRPSRRSPAGSPPRKPPATGTPSAATHPPPASTGTRSSPPSATPSPETPGYRQSPPTPELRP
jgi:hypothetical protein